jgi:hypothetical protein
MYYAGESNVPGAPGNVVVGMGGPTPPPFKMPHSYNPEGANTTGYPVGHTPQLTGFMNLPGAIGNMGAIAANPSFDINESAATRRIRGVRNLQSGGGTAGERDAASNLLRNITSPIRLPNL